jgi:hypothetical protein
MKLVNHLWLSVVRYFSIRGHSIKQQCYNIYEQWDSQ